MDQTASQQYPPAPRRRHARAQARGPRAAQGGPGPLPRVAAARHSRAGPGRPGAAHDGRARGRAARGRRGHAQGIHGHACGHGGPPAPRVDRDAPAGAGLRRRGGRNPAAAVARPAAHERRRRRRRRRLVAGPASQQRVVAAPARPAHEGAAGRPKCVAGARARTALMAAALHHAGSGKTIALAVQGIRGRCMCTLDSSSC